MSPILLLLVPVLLAIQLVLTRVVLLLRAKVYGNHIKSDLLQAHPGYAAQAENRYWLTGRQVFLLLANVGLMAVLAFALPPNEMLVILVLGMVLGLALLPMCHNISYILQFRYVQRHPEALEGEMKMSLAYTANTLVWDVLKYLPLVLALLFLQPTLFMQSFATGWGILLLLRILTARSLIRTYAAKPIEDHLIESR
ncbi:MAG: hypothetical protein IT260_01655 [Saprospiraceae bacterium]|nr:hypothetical protein [Saprospiraceae bacterium]